MAAYDSLKELKEENRKLRTELRRLHAALSRERKDHRSQIGLFDRAISTNDLRQVGEDMYRHFFQEFGVCRGDITILTDYDERGFYDIIGWTPKDRPLTAPELQKLAEKHQEQLNSLIEEQIFIGYTREEENHIRRSRMMEKSMLECMLSKKPRIVNDVFAELTPAEQKEARTQRTKAWVNLVILNPENSKLLAKMHMSFRTPKKYTRSQLASELGPFENLLRHRILHTRDFKRVKYLSECDNLTGFHLRTVVAGRFDHLIYQLKKRQKPDRLSLVMMDLDHFKKFNDKYGHDVGDTVLKTFSAAVQGSVRSTDMVGRYGGEEFVALLPGTRAKDVLVILDRISARIRDVDCRPKAQRSAGKGPEHIRFSAGLVTLTSANPRFENFDQAVKAADDLLLHSKRNGRNRCAFLSSSGRIRTKTLA
jgi:diguanylate cyclase (GGDEF)-like protein